MATPELMGLMQQAAEQAEAQMRAKLEAEMAAKLKEKEAEMDALLKAKEVELEERIEAESEAQRQALVERAAELDARAAQVDARLQAARGAEVRSTGRVVLDVGGTLFTTSESTLRAADRGESEDNVLNLLSRRTEAGADGRKEIFIDRTPEIYPALLDYLRTGDLPTAARAKQLLRREAEYLGLDALYARTGGRPREGAHSAGAAAGGAASPSAAAAAAGGATADEPERATWTQSDLTAALTASGVSGQLKLTHLNLDGLHFLGKADQVSSFRGSSLNGAILEAQGSGGIVNLSGVSSMEGLISSAPLAFTNHSFAGMSVKGWTLNLYDCKLGDGTFDGCTFTQLKSCSFEPAEDGTPPVFQNCTFSQVSFYNLVLKADLSGSTFSSCSFQSVRFAGVCFDDCVFQGCWLESGGSFALGDGGKKTSFRGAQLGRLDLRSLAGQDAVDFTGAT